MRTKTLALSAVLGMLGAAAALGQNVYSLNTVGFINVTLPPGYSIVTCPLICSPDNTIATLLNNSSGAYQSGSKSGKVYQYDNGVGYSATDTASVASGGTAGWSLNGTETINPGQAVFFFNPVNLRTGTNMLATFVGVVPQANIAPAANFPNGMTNFLVPGYNLVGSMIPVSGDIVTSPVSQLPGTSSEFVFVWDPTVVAGAQNGYGTQGQMNYSAGSWQVDPLLAWPYEGFWYHHKATGSPLTTNLWIETYVVNP